LTPKGRRSFKKLWELDQGTEPLRKVKKGKEGLGGHENGTASAYGHACNQSKKKKP